MTALTSISTLLRKPLATLSMAMPMPMSISSAHRYGFHSSKSPLHHSHSFIDSKLVNDFAAKNANLARSALKTPKYNGSTASCHVPSSISTSASASTSTSASIDEYLKWRGWEAKFIQDDMTNTLLSHALTFPLTLAYHANHFLQEDLHKIHHNSYTSQPRAHSIHDGDGDDDVHVNLCCVGSRAEANLPDEYWREFLIATNHFHSNSIDWDRHRGRNSRKVKDDEASPVDHARPIERVRIHWSIDCVGPEISPNSKTRRIHLHKDGASPHCQNTNEGEDEQDGAARSPPGAHSSLTLTYHKGLLHNHVLELYKKSKSKSHQGNVDDILNSWDGFILFNPGIGHPYLEQSWKPTVDFLLKTKKRIITTAHSEIDSERDWKLWSSQGLFFERTPPLLRYERNPFASKMSFEDPFPTEEDGVARVSPNYSICKF